LQYVIEHARQVSKEFDLCSHCIGRLYVSQIKRKSCKRLGNAIYKQLKKAEPPKCYICKNLYQRLKLCSERLQYLTDNVEFSSFMIGVTLAPSILDRDDLIRSRYKIKGAPGIKADVAGEIARRFRQKVGVAIDHVMPELIATVDLRKDTIDIYTRPVFVSGRYVKKTRGLPQKRRDCESIEKHIFEFLVKVTGARGMTITFVGHEDQNSLVLGCGRPFFARLVNPKRRTPKLPDTVKVRQITLHSLRMIKKLGLPVRFQSVARILVTTQDKVEKELLRSLRRIPESPVIIYEESGRINKKRISMLRYKRVSPNSIAITIEAEGGLPIKRFVEGSDVNPNITDMLETKCSCAKFDFLQVDVL